MRNRKKEPVPENAWIGTMKRRALTLYMLNGEYLIRTRSSLSAEKVKRAACFKNTRRSADRLSKASSLAAAVYNQLPEGWKLHSLYRTMTGIATLLLKAGDQDDTAITTALWKYLEEAGFRKDIVYETIQPSTVEYEERVRYKVQGLKYKVQSVRSFYCKPLWSYQALVNARIPSVQRGKVVKTRYYTEMISLDSG